MKAITRQPRLLVKMPAAPPQVTLALGASKFDVEIEPLFQSIQDEPALGAAASAQWQIIKAASDGDEVNAWDMCHELTTGGLGVAGVSGVEFAEPDLEQRWIYGSELEQGLAAVRSCDQPEPANPKLPAGDGVYWFRDEAHSQLQLARDEVGQPANRICIAHFDTGYDPAHITKPGFLRTDLQRNFDLAGHWLHRRECGPSGDSRTAAPNSVAPRRSAANRTLTPVHPRRRRTWQT